MNHRYRNLCARKLWATLRCAALYFPTLRTTNALRANQKGNDIGLSVTRSVGRTQYGPEGSEEAWWGEDRNPDKRTALGTMAKAFVASGHRAGRASGGANDTLPRMRCTGAIREKRHRELEAVMSGTHDVVEKGRLSCSVHFPAVGATSIIVDGNRRSKTCPQSGAALEAMMIRGPQHESR